METHQQDSDLSLRLIKGSFLLETGVNISLMFSVESLIVDASALPSPHHGEAVKHFSKLLLSNELVEAIADRINEYYRSTFTDNPQALESIIGILEGPLSFEAAFFLTALDPALRAEIRERCRALAPRYKGVLQDSQARDVLERIFATGEAKIADKRFTVLLSPERRKEIETEFKDYLGRYRDSSQEEIQARKIRFNVGLDTGSFATAMPVAKVGEVVSDWRSFCRTTYLSNKFNIFPDLLEVKILSLTSQEALFIPRSAEILRTAEKRSIRIFDGIRYVRERLSRPSPKIVNLHGNRGCGTSTFCRMLAFTMAGGYSRGHSKLIPIYIDMAGRTSEDLVNFVSMIDREVLKDVPDLTNSWQSEPSVMIIDNFDRTLFASEAERDRFLASFTELASMVRKGGVVLVTDLPIAVRKSGVDIEIVKLDEFDREKMSDWITTWCATCGKKPVPVEQLSEPVLHLLGSPNFLWLALLCIWEDFRARPAMSLGGFLKLLVDKLSDRAAQYVLVGERKVLSADGILRFATEIAWLNYSKGAGVDEEKCRELLWKHKLEINPSLLLRTRPAKLFDIKGGRQTHILVELPQGVVSSFLVALRFIESLEGKDLLSVLGRPISDEIFEFILEMLRVRGATASPESEAWLRRTRDQLWGWYSLQAVAVIPKKVLSGGVVFSDIELYADFRLLCLLLCAEINLLLKDDRPLTASAPKAISLLVKSLQSNPYPGRLDFRKRLAGANLKGGEFEDVDLEGADFSGCKLEEARFRRCCLNGAKLDGASLVGAAIENCSALKATANGADFTGCTVRYCDFSGSKLREAKINASSFVSVSFAGASLVSVSMSKSHFSTASFENANMNVARLEKSDFNSADFSGAKLVGAHIANCTLSLCVFRKANLLIADFSGSKFSSPLLEDCDGTGMLALKTEFEDLSCYRSNFTEASLGGASLPEAKMHQVDFTNADLSGVTLKGSDVRSVQFSGANLTMASLAGAIFKDPAGLETIKLADGLDLSGSIGLEPKIRLALKRLGAKD